jgi:hypothetical protein
MIYITTISLMGAFIAFCLGVIAYLLRTSFTVGGLLREMILRMSNLEKAVLNGITARQNTQGEALSRIEGVQKEIQERCKGHAAWLTAIDGRVVRVEDKV